MKPTPEIIQFIIDKRLDGWSAGEIAVEMRLKFDDITITDHIVRYRMKQLGLPTAISERTKRIERERTRQMHRNRDPNFLKNQALAKAKRFAVEHGWPDDLTFRQVRVLNLIWDRGPMTRPEIAAAMGWSEAGIADAGILTSLVNRGLMVELAKTSRRSMGPGTGRKIYSLPFNIQRLEAADASAA